MAIKIFQFRFPMRNKLAFAAALVALMPGGVFAAAFHNPYGKFPTNETPGDRMFAEYFRNEARALGERCMADVHTRQDWEQSRGIFASSSTTCSDSIRFHPKQI